ncbi:MAG: tyrosine-type recombinase/integrase [Bacteroides sp.]
MRYHMAYNYCVPLVDVPIINIKSQQLKDIVEECDRGSSTKKMIKTLMLGVFDYAVENDIVAKNYASFIDIEASDPTFDRVPFSPAEIQRLWDNADKDDCKIMLILLYSGMRVNELLKMPRDMCDIDNRIFHVLKAKTAAGIRDIPIHSAIYPIVCDFYKRNGSMLTTSSTGSKFAYNNFVTRNLQKMNNTLFETTHRFHDTRHTFITRAHEVRMDELCLKKICGHTAKDITSRVYTHISTEELAREIEKITY